MANYVKCNFSVTHIFQKSKNCHLLSSFDITCLHNSLNLLRCELMKRLMLVQCVWPQNWKQNVKMEDFYHNLKILVDFLLCCGLEQHFIGHILLLSVYNCAGLSLLGPKRREKKQEKDMVMSTSRKLRNWVLENYPLNIPIFIALCCIKMCWMF